MVKCKIFRTVKITKPVTGEQIINAFKKVASELKVNFVQEEACDFDDVVTYYLGFNSEYPYERAYIRTGVNLSESEINPKGVYSNIGLTNIPSFTPECSMSYAVIHDKKDVNYFMNKAKEGLEKLLI